MGCLGSSTQMQMKILRELWLSQCRLLEELFCKIKSIKLTFRSNNWDEVKTKDYEGKDRPEVPKG
jgi:hypothetical protein